MTQRTSQSQGGFTLIELLLAMAFVGFILTFIVIATIDVMGNYNKGIVVKEINQTARTIVEEMGRLARSTTGSAINTTAIGSGGRVCFGGVSYVWNNRGSENNNRYANNQLVAFARVEDPAGALCVSGTSGYPAVDPAKATELIGNQIWVQDVSVVVSPNQKLVDLRLRLSTGGDNRPTQTSVSGNVCGGGREGNYCATAVFGTTVSTRNGGN